MLLTSLNNTIALAKINQVPRAIMQEYTFEQPSQEQQDLLFAAETAMSNGLNPSTDFVVGSAVRTTIGSIFMG